MIQKAASILLAAALSAGACGLFAGCGDVISGVIDETKSQLCVGNYDGGVGTQWLYDAADRFEQMYTTTEFEPGTGKVGVEVVVDPNILALAKLFVRFLCTDAEMQYFTAETDMPKSYDMPQELLDEMTYYGRNVWAYNKSGSVIMPYSSSELYRNNVSSLWYTYDWESVVGTQTYAYPVDALRSGVSAKNYFLGMAVSKEAWDNAYSKDFA